MPICAEDAVESDSIETANINMPKANPRTERFIFIASLFNLAISLKPVTRPHYDSAIQTRKLEACCAGA
jgi:hypothetical protein